MAGHWDLRQAVEQMVELLPLLPCLTLGPSADTGVLPSSPEWISSSGDLLPRPDHFLIVLLQACTHNTTSSSYKTP